MEPEKSSIKTAVLQKEMGLHVGSLNLKLGRSCFLGALSLLAGVIFSCHSGMLPGISVAQPCKAMQPSMKSLI